MDKLKKLGLTALAGSMVATSVAAGEFGVTGGMAWSWDSNDSDETGNPMSMTNDVLFTGSGETDQGWTATVALELDDGTAVDESITLDFGDGQCDDIATKTVDGVDHEFKIEKIVMDKMDK